MKNKITNKAEFELLLQLREVVNSKEEFDYIESELARLTPPLSAQLNLTEGKRTW